MVESNPAQRNTPLVTEECEGHVTVTDPRHPLFGKILKLAGVAYLPGHIRHCQVEILPGQFGHVPVSCTNLSTSPRPEPTLLTLAVIEELLAVFDAVGIARRRRHGSSTKPHGVGTPVPSRTRRGQSSHHSHSHGRGGK